MNNRNRLTIYILAGLVLGIVVGYFVNASLANPAGFADIMSLVTTLFLRLIKMIIAPLVFSTLVVGIARMGDTKEVGPHRHQGAGLVRHRVGHFAVARPDPGEPVPPGRRDRAGEHGAGRRHRIGHRHVAA